MRVLGGVCGRLSTLIWDLALPSSLYLLTPTLPTNKAIFVTNRREK